MKIAALSDFHGRLIDVPPCDLCIIAGDFCPVEEHDLYFQQHWLDNIFRNWLNLIPAKKIIGIAGNHDQIYDHGDTSNCPPPKDLNWSYIQDELIEYEGIKIYGTPYQAKFNGWPFMRTEKELEKLWADMPKCDIIVSHGPPYGVADVANGMHTGMKTLSSKIEELEIPYCICGHIHENYGSYKYLKNTTTIMNVALCDDRYQIRHKPMIFEI